MNYWMLLLKLLLFLKAETQMFGKFLLWRIISQVLYLKFMRIWIRNIEIELHLCGSVLENLSATPIIIMFGKTENWNFLIQQLLYAWLLYPHMFHSYIVFIIWLASTSENFTSDFLTHLFFRKIRKCLLFKRVMGPWTKIVYIMILMKEIRLFIFVFEELAPENVHRR